MFQEKYKYLPHLFILLAGSMWGCTGLFNRHLSALGLSSQNIVLVRNLGACVVLVLIFLFYDRSLFRIRLRHLPIFLGTGLVSLLLFTLCYFRCQQVTDLSTAAILLYTAPTFVVVLSAILWREKITKRKLAALVIAFLGCCFASGILSGGLSVSRYGLLLGIGSGFFYSTYTIFSRYGLAHYPPYTCTRYTFLWASSLSPPSCPTSSIPGAWRGWETGGRPPSWPAWSRWWPPSWASWPLASPCPSAWCWGWRASWRRCIF